MRCKRSVTLTCCQEAQVPRRQASDWQHEIYRHKLSKVAARRPAGNAKTWHADARRSFPSGLENLKNRCDRHALLPTLLCDIYSWCILAGRRATQRRGRGLALGVPVTRTRDARGVGSTADHGRTSTATVYQDAIPELVCTGIITEKMTRLHGVTRTT